MGWRVGYIAYPDADNSDFLGLQLVKVCTPCEGPEALHWYCDILMLKRESLRACVQVQDTIPIHAAHMSQQVALRSLRAGPQWLNDRIGELKQNR